MPKYIDRTIEHAAYDEWVRDDEDGNPIYRTIECGDWVVGQGNAYCAECEEELQERYPQGWAYYPGDTCMHRVYVGGVGIDWMCGDCEMGYTHWYDEPTFELFVIVNGGGLSPIKLARYTGKPDPMWYSGRVKTFIKSIDETTLEHVTVEYEWRQTSAGYWGEPPSAIADSA